MKEKKFQLGISVNKGQSSCLLGISGKTSDKVVVYLASIFIRFRSSEEFFFQLEISFQTSDNVVVYLAFQARQVTK